MTTGQAIELGPFRFHVVRMMILVGLIRVAVRGEGTGNLNRLDLSIVLWGAWALFSSVFHKEPGDALVYRMGMAFNTLGIYFLFRILCRSIDDATFLVRAIAILLVPLALEMLSEQLTGKNLFSIFGRVSENVVVRNGSLRAQGPFAHAILAGTIGAACFPLMSALWSERRKMAFFGGLACLVMVFASASSGPLMSLMFSGFALVMWRWRSLVPKLRIWAVVAYFGLELIMSRPAYFIISKFDLTGSSTGWHRAELIRSSIEHLPEWWIGGTDYTRHWMPTGVSFSPEHTDITNQYIAYGVHGGLPLVLLFIAAIWVAFLYIGRLLEAMEEKSDLFFVWTLGAGLFAHITSCISIAYFDQSFVFLYLNLAAIASLREACRWQAPAHVEARQTNCTAFAA